MLFVYNSPNTCISISTPQLIRYTYSYYNKIHQNNNYPALHCLFTIEKHSMYVCVLCGCSYKHIYANIHTYTYIYVGIFM